MKPLRNIITEIQREQAMRRKVWPRVKGQDNPPQFLDQNHERQYVTMADALTVFEAMTEREFSTLTERISRQKEAESAQTTLF